MKPFVDSGFLLTLLFKTSGSPKAWKITRELDEPLLIGTLQIFNTENRLLRQIAASDSTPEERAVASAGLGDFRWYLKEHVFAPVHLDYDIAINLAAQWQTHDKVLLPALLLLWPAMAATIGATVFLSFDPRTRHLAKISGLKLLPEKL